MKKITMFLSVCCLLAAALSGCANTRILSPAPTPTPTLISLTEAERAKIDPDLLAVIEWEEQHSGGGHGVAPEDFFFDDINQVRCMVFLSDEKVNITLNSGNREANLGAVRETMSKYGGTVVYEREDVNSISIMILLKDIKRLVTDEMVVKIQPDRKVRPISITAP